MGFNVVLPRVAAESGKAGQAEPSPRILLGGAQVVGRLPGGAVHAIAANDDAAVFESAVRALYNQAVAEC